MGSDNVRRLFVLRPIVKDWLESPDGEHYLENVKKTAWSKLSHDLMAELLNKGWHLINVTDKLSCEGWGDNYEYQLKATMTADSVLERMTRVEKLNEKLLSLLYDVVVQICQGSDGLFDDSMAIGTYAEVLKALVECGRLERVDGCAKPKGDVV